MLPGINFKELISVTAKNKVEIRIAGKEYTLVGIESDEYLQKVALYIDRKMNEIMRVNSKLSTSMVAVLTAINVADDFFKAQESDRNFRSEATQLKEELEKLKEENNRLISENDELSEKNKELQLELAKRQGTLDGVKNSMGTKPVKHRAKFNIAQS